MAKFHETKIPKWQKIIGYILSLLFSFQIFMAGIIKIISNPDMNENMVNLGPMADNILLVGIGELLLLILYWLPKTHKLGFYLMCSFVGGRPVFIGVSTAIILYIGTIMRFPSLIKS